MPYKFRLQEPLDAGARRIAREQMQRAAKAFDDGAPSDQAIHGARRRLKKVRALLRLIRPALGGKAYKHWNAELRDAGLLFSSARDLVVMKVTAEALSKSAPARAKPALTSLQRLIDAAQAQAALDAGNNALAAGLGRIRSATSEIEGLSCDGMSIGDLAEGAAMGLEQSQKAFTRAYSKEDDESFHEWRKTVQRHWRHMQLLQPAWPAFFDARAGLAQDIARLTGDDHDLSVLKTFAAERIDNGVTEKQAELLFDLAQKRQDKLRAKAKALGRALLATAPKTLGHEIEAYWEMSKERKLNEAPLIIKPDDDEADRADKVVDENASVELSAIRQ